MKQFSKHLQAGFAHVELLVVTGVILTVGLVGGYVWHAGHTKHDATLTLSGKETPGSSGLQVKPLGAGQSDTAIQAAPSVSTSYNDSTGSHAPAHNNTDKNYLYIPEWNVKVKFNSADPSCIGYTIKDFDSTDSVAYLSLQSSITKNDLCQQIDPAIGRHHVGTPWYVGPDPDQHILAHSTTIGNYEYSTDFEYSPYNCGNDTFNVIRLSYLHDNYSTWTYSAIK